MAKKEIKNKKEEPVYESFLLDDATYKTLLTKKYHKRKPYEEKDPKKILAFIPGKIKKVYTKNGAKVKEGEKLLVLEAMKMNNTIFSPLKGTIKEVYVTAGMSVAKDALLIELD